MPSPREPGPGAAQPTESAKDSGHYPLKEFFERYRRAKFPNDTIAINVLKSLGIPAERAMPALETIKDNGRYATNGNKSPLRPP